MAGLANLALSAVAVGVGGNTPASISLTGKFAMRLSGTFVATIAVERSIDGGVSFQTVQSFSNVDAPTVQIGEEINQDGALYRFNVTAWTSGTVVGSLDQ